MLVKKVENSKYKLSSILFFDLWDRKLYSFKSFKSVTKCQSMVSSNVSSKRKYVRSKIFESITSCRRSSKRRAIVMHWRQVGKKVCFLTDLQVSHPSVRSRRVLFRLDVSCSPLYILSLHFLTSVVFPRSKVKTCHFYGSASALPPHKQTYSLHGVPHLV